MRIKEAKKGTIIKSAQFEEVGCTIDPENVRHIASLLRNNYSDPIWAAVREIIANAVDACWEIGNGKLPLVTLPNRLSRDFSVRDYGAGLNREDVFGLYSKYGKSTKRGSNTPIGGFGIGRFAPLSYGDSFTLESFVDGVCSIYMIRVNELNDTIITEMASKVTNEENGVKIVMATKAEDCDRFSKMANRLLFFGSKFGIKGKQVSPDFDDLAPATLSNKDWQLRKLQPIAETLLGYNNDNKRLYGGYTAKHYVVMGGISYPIDISNIAGEAGEFLSSLGAFSLILELKVGAIKLHHSREMLEYKDVAKNTLIDAIKKVRKEMLGLMQANINKSKNFCSAVEKFKEYGQLIGGSFKLELEWNGRPLARMWDLSAKFTDSKKDYYIDVWKFEKNASNVSGIRTQKGVCKQGEYDEKSVVMYDDYEGNRVKNLMRKVKFLLENKKMDVVYVVRFDSGNRKKFVAKMKENHFDELAKSGNFFNLSEAEEIPLPPRVKGKRGKRVSVSLSGVQRWMRSSYRASNAWGNVDASTLPAVKYYLPTERGNIRRLDKGGLFVAPHRFKMEASLERAGLPKETEVFGCNNAATARVSKLEDWVDFREVVKEKLDAFVAKNPEISSVLNDTTFISAHKFMEKFVFHSDIDEGVREKFSSIYSKIALMNKSNDKGEKLRDEILEIAQGIGYTYSEKTIDSEKTDIETFTSLTKKYLPHIQFVFSYGNHDWSDKCASFMRDVINHNDRQMKATVRIANAIYKSEEI
jgi:hypothetical protein